MFVIGAGVTLGALWPEGNAPPIAPPVQTQPSKSPAKTPNTDPLDVVLERRQNGHFYANVNVNGHMIEFLVDTGATAIALTADDARKLGFHWTDAELGIIGHGVSGPVSGKMVELHHLKLGGREAWDMDAAIIPQGLSVSLLGQNFLRQIGSLKISGDQMVLR